MSSGAPEIAADNYRKEARLLEEELRRFGDAPPKGALATMAGLSEGIGTLCWQFGDAQASKWFERSLELYRQSTSDLTIKVALLLWKMRDRAAFQRECEGVIEFHARRLQATKAGQLDLPERQLVRAYRESAFAHFLRDDYERARECAEQALGFGWERQTPGDMTALVHLVQGLGRGDEMAFIRGLEILRSSCQRWPTASASVFDDLLRYGLAVGMRRFPEVTRLFEPFGNGQGHGLECPIS